MEPQDAPPGIVPPIVAMDGHDIAYYDSLEVAEVQYCQFEDATDDTFFDSTGRILEPVRKDRREGIDLLATDVINREELREALVKYLRVVGEPIGDAAMLPWLLERCRDRTRRKSLLQLWWPFLRRCR